MDVSKVIFTKNFYLVIVVLSLFNSFMLYAQPQDSVSCVVSVGNRNSPLAVDGTYVIAGIPGNLGAVRARAICSDGSLGQSGISFTDPVNAINMVLGPIEFGVLTPVPISANLSSLVRNLNTSETSQMQFSAIGADGSVFDVTNKSAGTVYSISNELIANITENGLVGVTAEFDTASSSKLLVSATTEGSVSSTYSFDIGPLGKLQGTVYLSDAITVVSGIEVSVHRQQPREVIGNTITDQNGIFEFDDVSAGNLIIYATNPATNEQKTAFTTIASQGQLVTEDIIFDGVGVVEVTVIDDSDNLVPDADVTLTSLGLITDVRAAPTNQLGVVTYNNVQTGEVSLSTVDPATGSIGAFLGEVVESETLYVTLRLQDTGTIGGVVFDTDGTTILPDTQIRLSSRAKGVVSQSLSNESGEFNFDSIPKIDGPFILDAFVDGRLRARVPGIVYLGGVEHLERDIILGPAGIITGVVKNSSNTLFPGALVQVQFQDGLRQSFDAFTNESGEFIVPGTQLGEFEITATTTDGQIAQGSGELVSDGESVFVELVVVENAVVGTVFERDGQTPVGPGVTVYLAQKANGQVYTYEDVPEARSTVTDENGMYGFTVTEIGDYYIQAENQQDRGRSQVTIVNLNSSQPLNTDVVFLAKGELSGTVFDANGIIQSGVTVTLFTEGSFNVERETVTDDFGRFIVEGVFVGDITVKAVNEVTEQSGLRITRIEEEGESVDINIYLNATGSVAGNVLDANAVIIEEPTNLVVYSNNNVFYEGIINDGTFEVDLIPLGDVRVVAELVSSGDRGESTTRINFLNELKTIDVNLIGQGSLEVTLLDDLGLPVTDAKVTVTNQEPYESSFELISNELGQVFFENVYSGDYSVNALKSLTFGSLQGQSSGTMVANDAQQVTIVMNTVAVGSVSGTVLSSDGVTPSGAGWAVKMLPEPFENAYLTSSNAQGEFSISPVNAGNYTIEVYEFYDEDSCPVRGRIRARSPNASLSTQDENVVVDLQLIGSGRVHGRVLDLSGTPVADAKVTLINPDPVYGLNSTCGRGTNYVTTTAIDGSYDFTDIPPGNFTIIAENFDSSKRAEGQDRISFDGDEVELDLTLIDNVITMPYTFYDANGFKFDLSGDGSVISGTRNVFATGDANTAAMKLEIVTNDIAVPFVNGNGSIGSLRSDGQEVTLDDITPSGLRVERKIFTPRSGYFTRYLEILENPTDQQITVDVRVKSSHRSDSSNARIVDTSSGDQVLSVGSQSTSDKWVTIDDQNDTDPFVNGSIPVIGYVFDGNDGDQQVTDAQFELLGQTGRLVYDWDDVTVSPGERVILMHFVYGQIQRFSSRSAANRLLSLPPEAIDDLTTDEKNSVLNFSIPEFSNVDPLPNLSAGYLSGKVLSGDGVSIIPGVKVTFQSQHVLFSRIRNTNSNDEGFYEFQSTLDGTALNYVIPVFNYDLSAEYELTDTQSPVSPGSFSPNTTENIQDIIFIGTGDITGAVKTSNGSNAGVAEIKLCEEISPTGRCNSSVINRTTSGVDGNYTLFANPPHDYYVFAEKTHPQNHQFGGLNITGYSFLTSSPSDVTVSNIFLEPTGSIAGFVRSDDGNIVTNAEVSIYDLNGRALRETVTDTAGFYRLFDVLVGSYRLVATDTVSQASGEAFVDTTADVETEQDITLTSDTLVNINVKYLRDVFAEGVFIIIFSIDDGSVSYQGLSDSNGLAQFQIAEGEYTLYASHPDNQNLRTTYVFSVQEQILEQSETVILPGSGELSGNITRPDATTSATGFPYSITQISGDVNYSLGDGSTNEFGVFNINGIPFGEYIITAYDDEQNRFADATFTIENDGELIELNLSLIDNSIALPTNLFDVNRFQYDIQPSGEVLNGSNAYMPENMALKINGEKFVGKTSARLQAGNRQLLIEQDTPLSGLNVSRKVYVPRGGYFVRYIDVLENPENTDVIVDVSLDFKYNVGEYLQTSDGDISLTNQDSWFLVDDDIDKDILIDQNQMPVSGTVISDDSASLKPSDTSISYVDLAANVTESWNQITVPAGGKVSLMHFSLQQINRQGALFAAQRLSGLPPEVLVDLSIDDQDSIVNFTLPVDLTSLLDPLPELTGSISGLVLEAGESIIVPETNVTVKSSHPLFSRVWGMQSDPFIQCLDPGTPVSSLFSNGSDGTFGLQGQLSDQNAIALPKDYTVTLTSQVGEFCYDVSEGHPVTQFPSRVVDVLPGEETNVIFDTTIISGAAIGSLDYSVTNGKVYRSIGGSVDLDEDGLFSFSGNPFGTYDLIFETEHPDAFGADVLRGVKTQIDLNGSQVVFTNIPMQPTGNVQGTVIAPDGSFVENAEIRLTSDASQQNYIPCAVDCDVNALLAFTQKRPVSRKLNSDSLGGFNFNTVPDGEYTMSVTDPVSGGISSVTLSVIADQTTVENLVIQPLGAANLLVLDSSGSPVQDSFVYLSSESLPDELVVGRTDIDGELTIPNIPAGTYTLRVTDYRAPQFEYMDVFANGEITTMGQIDELTVNLKSAASISLDVINSDNSPTEVAGADISIFDAGGTRALGVTDTNGNLFIPLVPVGSYVLSAEYTFDNDNFRQESVVGDIEELNDNQTIDLEIDLRSRQVSLPVELNDANGNLYEVSDTDEGLPELYLDNILFIPDSIATSELSNRQIQLNTGGLMSGVQVERQLFVPSNGYFIRVIETLENQSNSDITLDLKTTSNLSSRNLYMTSSGDAIVDNIIDPDRWVVTGYSDTFRNHSIVSGGQGVNLVSPNINYNEISTFSKNVELEWSDLTIPANSQIKLMHFYVKQDHTDSAIASAERLIQLPPESLIGLINDDIQEIINFNLPIDLISDLDELPALNGTINGIVYEGDGITEVNSANITIESKHVLFRNRYNYTLPHLAGLRTDEGGNFLITGSVLDNNYPVAVPVDGEYTIIARHPNSNLESSADVSFQNGDSVLTQDLTFATGSITGTVTGAFNPPENYDDDISIRFTSYQTEANQDGSFTINGLPADTYDVLAELKRGNFPATITGENNDVTVEAGLSTNINIVYEPNGSITGEVASFNGVQQPNQDVELYQNGDLIRSTSTDGAGIYEMGALPIGNYTIQVTDSDTDSVVSSEVTVLQNQATISDFTLLGTSQVTITVRDHDGSLAVSSRIKLESDSVGGIVTIGTTNQSGVVVVNIAEGSFKLYASDPNNGIETNYEGNITQPNTPINVDITLQAIADIDLEVVNSDDGSNVVGATVTITDQLGQRGVGVTDALGKLLINNIPEGGFTIRATATIDNAIRTASINGSVVSANHNQIIDAQIDLKLLGTIFDINVLDADGNPIDSQARLSIYRPGMSLLTAFTNSQGQYSFIYNGDDQIRIVANRLSNTQIIANAFVEPNFGETVLVELPLIPSTIEGTVFDHDGTTAVASNYIEVLYSENNVSIKGMFTDSNGKFMFENLPVDNDLYLRARDPINDVFTDSNVITTLSDPQTYDLTLNGYGTVEGRVYGAGDIPKTNTSVRASYDDNSGSTFSDETLNAQTDENGNYSFNRLPLNQPLTVGHYYFDDNIGSVSIEDTVSLNQHGANEVVDLFIPGAAFSFNMVAADGLPINKGCEVEISQGDNSGESSRGGGNIIYISCDEAVNLIGLPAGELSIRVTLDFNEVYSNTFQLNEDEALSITHTLSVINGTVTYFDSTPVPNPTICAGNLCFQADIDGNFRLLGNDVGFVEIRAIDSVSSLSTILTAEIIDNTIPVDIVIQLPASGSISGTVYGIDSLPMAGIEVFANSANSNSVQQDTTDANGEYLITGIVAGSVELNAYDAATTNIATEMTSIDFDGDTKIIDLQFNQPGSITGEVKDLNLNIVEDACIEVQYSKNFSVYQNLNITASSDALGKYEIDSIPSGEVLVSAKDSCSGTTATGLEISEIIDGSETVTDIDFGNAVPLRHKLNDGGNNFSFDVLSNGRIKPENNNPTGSNDNEPFLRWLGLLVNNKRLNNHKVAFTQVNDNQVQVGPTIHSGFSFNRKVYVPASGDFSRILDSITNITLDPIEVTVKLSGSYGSDFDDNPNPNVVLAVDPINTQNRYAVHSYDQVVGNMGFFLPPSDYPANVSYIFSDDSDLVNNTNNFKPFQSDYFWSWTTTIQPGETVGYLSFIAAGAPDDLSSVLSTTNDIISGVNPEMLTGLTVEEKNSIVNFEVQ